MARLTDELKQTIVAEWKNGTSQNDLAKIYGVSKGTVNKYCKGVEQSIVPLVNAQVQINQHLNELNERERSLFNETVTEQTKHLIYFQNSALKGQQLANDALDYVTDRYNNADTSEKEEMTGQAMLVAKEHANLTVKNKESVLGKQPDTAIQINNTNSNTGKSLDDFYKDV